MYVINSLLLVHKKLRSNNCPSDLNCTLLLALYTIQPQQQMSVFMHGLKCQLTLDFMASGILSRHYFHLISLRKSLGLME